MPNIHCCQIFLRVKNIKEVLEIRKICDKYSHGHDLFSLSNFTLSKTKRFDL